MPLESWVFKHFTKSIPFVELQHIQLHFLLISSIVKCHSEWETCVDAQLLVLMVHHRIFTNQEDPERAGDVSNMI